MKLSNEYMEKLTTLSQDYDLITSVKELDIELDAVKAAAETQKGEYEKQIGELNTKLLDLQTLNQKLVLRIGSPVEQEDNSKDKIAQFFSAFNK